MKFDKNGLIPAIIQDAKTKDVLMLGYMNQEAVKTTKAIKKVTFYSRSKKRLWTKGETSGNYLELVDMQVDCDQDALLVKVDPKGPTCHKGTTTCWGDTVPDTISYLEQTIRDRKSVPQKGSYVSDLFERGMNKIAQKVGEEAVELVIEAKDDNAELFKNEAADLFFHYLVLLQAKNIELNEVLAVLEERRQKAMLKQ